MRNKLNARQFKKYLDLPLDYRIDGVLCYGTSNQEGAFTNFKESLVNKDYKYKITRFKNQSLRSVFEVDINNKKLWFIATYGSAELSELIHIACLFGSKKNILIGSCGGLNSKMKVGDFIIPTSSLGQESSARMYNRKSALQHPDNNLSEKIYTRLSEHDKTWRGSIMTCQGSLAETKDDIKKWSSEGYFGVEMETSTFFAVSNYFSVPSAASLYVADNVIKGQTPLSISFAKQKDIRHKSQLIQLDVSIQELLV